MINILLWMIIGTMMGYAVTVLARKEEPLWYGFIGLSGGILLPLVGLQRASLYGVNIPSLFLSLSGASLFLAIYLTTQEPNA
jgi:hypothetical protein